MSFFTTIANNDSQLKHLRAMLTHLPDCIPLGNSRYHFENFAPDPEKVELYGSAEAALNNVLEVTFASKGRKDESAPCPFEFQEHGPGLIAVVDVLTATLEEFPESALLQKWAKDLWCAAVYHYKSAKKKVGTCLVRRLPHSTSAE
ncbi:uncharacterized protein F5891DRAFT_1187612 [Suillus fuscotomentosus]|uniref:Uncharacterized protein n=1 Tax=Suillus fuscotomentosus TaxID=1912939 RepID=A0AAD4E8L8_9AGAM|nr:uncharacterized protein F5891DRAFT_1187612 [Suillus fuscotomentosus]KAG1901336.1 hypothetical protein F5891DRAFT_1187612 [Suillus fuscotomentosus]